MTIAFDLELSMALSAKRTRQKVPGTERYSKVHFLSLSYLQF
jgi:hypothetical protein